MKKKHSKIYQFVENTFLILIALAFLMLIYELISWNLAAAGNLFCALFALCILYVFFVLASYSWHDNSTVWWPWWPSFHFKDDDDDTYDNGTD